MNRVVEWLTRLDRRLAAALAVGFLTYLVIAAVIVVTTAIVHVFTG